MSDCFLIRRAELLALAGHVRQICTELQNASEAGIGSMDQFLNNDSVSGAFVSSAKAYMAQVYRVILQGIAQAACVLNEEFWTYAQGYDAIDGAGYAVLPSDQMDEFVSGLNRSFFALSECGERVRGIVQSVSSYAPGVSVSGAAWEAAGEETRSLCMQVRRLQEAVMEQEQHTLGRLWQLYALTDSLEQTVRLIGAGDCPELGFGVYVSGSFLSISGLQEGFLAEKSIAACLSSCGFGGQQIAALANYGYTPADLLRLYESCETDSDRAFLQSLFAGDYGQAFATDPLRLSDSVSLALSDYACRLYGAGDKEQLQEFINGILLQTAGTGWFSEPGPGVRTVRMSYLEDLFQGTMVLLEMNSSMLLQDGVTEEMKERNWNLLSLAGLWETQYHLEEDLQYRRDPRYPPVISLHEGDREAGEMDYVYYYTQISHNPFQDRGEVASIRVSSDILETSEDLLNGTYLAEREHLQESADELLRKVVGESIWNCAGSVLGIAIPEIGTVMGMLKTAVKEDTKKADNQLLNMVNKTLPQGTGMEGILLGEAIDGLQTYLDKNAELSERISQLDRLYEGSIWGSGVRGSYEIPDIFSSSTRTYILSGIYNPDYLEVIGNWNREGIAALIPEADAREMYRILAESPFIAAIPEESLEYKMIFGFGTGSIFDYPISEIAVAKQNVESIVRRVFEHDDFAAGWNIERGF